MNNSNNINNMPGNNGNQVNNSIPVNNMNMQNAEVPNNNINVPNNTNLTNQATPVMNNTVPNNNVNVQANNIVFDNNQQPLDNSTVDYNSLYNINANQAQIEEYNNQINEIDKKIAEEQIVNPEVTSLEKVNTDTPSDESEKGLPFIAIIAGFILIIILFLFPYIANNRF